MSNDQQMINQLAAIFEIALQGRKTYFEEKERDLYGIIVNDVKPILKNTLIFDDIQPEPTIDVVLNGRKIEMIPDMVVTTRNQKRIVVEVVKTTSKAVIIKSQLRLYNILENINTNELEIIGGVLLVFTPIGMEMRKITLYDEIKFVRVSIQSLGGGDAKLAVFVASSHIENPTILLDKAVSKYVGTHGFNQFKDVNSSNPWVRIVITGINNLEFDAFTTQRL